MGKKEKLRNEENNDCRDTLQRTIPYSHHQRWWSKETVAVVTGGNRGIGFEICRQLATHGLTVILTSRDASAVLNQLRLCKKVNNAGVNFNLGSDNSVENARKVIETNYYGTKRMTEAIISLMKPSLVGARIVNV
ncbi:hypothetical protein JHK86_024912 [Glycine max]|nr:hypothetical protein JHK86_024912 [Glycine max]